MEKILIIDEVKLRNFISKVPMWDYAGIRKFEYENLSKDDKKSLLIKYYHALLLKVEGEIIAIFLLTWFYRLVSLCLLLFVK